MATKNTKAAKKVVKPPMPTSELALGIIASIKSANTVQTAIEKAQAKVPGIYTQMTQLAASAPLEEFVQAANEVRAAINANVGGIATKTKCKKKERGTGYVLPSSYMTARSALEFALKNGVPLLDTETQEPRPFSQIREDNAEVRSLKRQSENGENGEARDALVEQLREAIKLLGTGEVDDACASTFETLGGVVSGWSEQYSELLAPPTADEEDEEGSEEMANAA